MDSEQAYGEQVGNDCEIVLCLNDKDQRGHDEADVDGARESIDVTYLDPDEWKNGKARHEYYLICHRIPERCGVQNDADINGAFEWPEPGEDSRQADPGGKDEERDPRDDLHVKCADRIEPEVEQVERVRLLKIQLVHE